MQQSAWQSVANILQAMCWVATVGLLSGAGARADDWPQWLGPERDGVWREKGIVERFPSAGPPLSWRTAIGAGYSGPAVIGERVYVTDRILDPGVSNPGNPFARDAVAGKERVLCLDDATGKVLWKHEYSCPYEVSYPAGPRATPVVQAGKVYTLGAMGDLLCLDERTGKVLWSKNLPREYGTAVPLWGFAAHPLLDGDKLICLVGGKGSVVVAFHKDTGAELWRALSAKQPGYCPPMIYHVGGKRQLIIWHPEAVNGLDPETGKVFWSHPFEARAALSIPTPRQFGQQLFITAFYDGSLMLQFEAGQPKPRVAWKGKARSELPERTDTLHSIMSTPFIKDGYIYGVCSYGELRCLKAENGERIWETLKATSGQEKERWSNAFLVAYEDRFFLFNEKGDLISARLAPTGYEELSRAHLLDATNRMVAKERAGGASVLWSHPAFAHQAVYARNDKELVKVSLAAGQ
jgi:outer membrane protein assembly factor BamB